jgi:hypothetical protein|tara:strand:+ start:113 stop:1258 length:1146 start_codon:yes stop_codon:yes gene_type:complete
MKKKSFLLYLKFIFWFSFSLIATISLVNYYVDPGNIYSSSKKNYNKKRPSKEFVKQLIKSDNGILFNNNIWNIRDIKKELAKTPTTADCAILGSSRVMQISSARPIKSLSNICPSLINFGVSGASLEDYLITSKDLLQNNKPLKTIVIGIDPWIFILNRDKRWRRHKHDFLVMKGKLEENSKNLSIKIHNETLFNTALLFNLINREYFIRSIKSLLSKKNRLIEHAPIFNYKEGFDRPVLLSDGSGIYTKNAQKKNRLSKTDGLVSYDIRGISNSKLDSGEWYQEKAIKLFVKLVNHLKKHFNIVFVITPYHPTVWEITNQPLVKAVKNLEFKVHQIAKTLNVQVIGSFNPNHVGCTKEEFIDLVHPRDECVSKLQQFTLN